MSGPYCFPGKAPERELLNLEIRSQRSLVTKSFQIFLRKKKSSESSGKLGLKFEVLFCLYKIELRITDPGMGEGRRIDLKVSPLPCYRARSSLISKIPETLLFPRCYLNEPSPQCRSLSPLTNTSCSTHALYRHRLIPQAG